jgi:hypothetical protein
MGFPAALFLFLALLLGACSGPSSNHPPPDFTISINPTNLTVQQGSSGTTTLTITPQNGFTGTVALSLVDGNGNPVPGITLAPTSVNLAGSSPVSQNLTVSVGSSVAPGTYSLQVRATSGSLTKTTGLSLTVTAPATDFSMVLESNTLTPRTGGHCLRAPLRDGKRRDAQPQSGGQQQQSLLWTYAASTCAGNRGLKSRLSLPAMSLRRHW